MIFIGREFFTGQIPADVLNFYSFRQSVTFLDTNPELSNVFHGVSH